jgi:hypothetical protein
MSQRSLWLSVLSAVLAFAGGYALLGTLQPVGDRAEASRAAGDPTKVVAVAGSAFVPVGDSSTDWMLVGPDGTLLAGPDGRPPDLGSTAGDYGSVDLATAGQRQDDTGVYLVNFLPEGGIELRDDGSRDRDADRHEDAEHDGHDDEDHDDHDDFDDDQYRDREGIPTSARDALARFLGER